MTSEADVALVKNAIETLRKGGASKATAVAAGISDPVARKLVEWIILRSDHNGADSTRYTAFMTANPSWPSLGAFRRRAEAMLWVENAKPARVMSFFDGSPPQSAMGRLVLARAMSRAGRHRRRQGAGAGYMAQRSDSRRCREAGARALPRPLEPRRSQGSHGEEACRRRQDAAMRAARRLGGADLAIAQLRLALASKGGGNAKKLLGAVPEEARRDPGYLFARAYLSAPRREDRRSRAGDAVGAHRSRTGPRRRGLVGRATDNGAQAAGYRGCPLGLSRRGGSRRADQGKLPGRAPFMAGLDRAAVPR